jgi:hypothetical protein
MPFLLVIALWMAANDAGLPGIKCDYEWHEGQVKTGWVLTIDKVSISIVDFNKKKQSYPFCRRLANGQLDRNSSDGSGYLPQDVQIGDQVLLHTISVDKQDFCYSIQIDRRRSGKVPPSRRETSWRAYHEVRQADNDFEDFKKPIPRFLQLRSKYWEYPAFDLNIPKEKRIARFPHDNPFSYEEWILFLR